MKISFSKYFIALLALTYLFSCSDDEDPEPPVLVTFEGVININPANFPEGGGLSLTAGDSGRVAQIDDEPNFDWDLLVITFRTAKGGRPGILLKGDTETTESVQAVNVSELDSGVGLGKAGFDSFTSVSAEMVAALKADGVFSFDPEVDVDASGKPEEGALLQAYENLVIGDRIVNLEEAEQPVYLVQTVSGAYFKFQLVKREGGGNTTLRWSRFGKKDIQ